MSLSDQFKGAAPSWKTGNAEAVLIRHRSGSVSSRRAYPVARNQRFVPPRGFENFTDIVSVGEGNDVHIEPAEDADPASDEAKDRVKRLKNVGGGIDILKDQEDGDLENRLRSVKEAPDSQISVTQSEDGDEVHIRGTGTSGTTQINIGGFLSFGANGMATTVLEGERGTTGKLSIIPCGEGASPIDILEWKEGQIVSDTASFQVGDCGGGGTTTYVPGP